MNTTTMMNTTTNNAIEIQMVTSECDIPVLKVTCPTPTNRWGTGYIMPFRAYRFQVCADTEGNCDCGSSDVKNMVDVLKWMPDFHQLEYLREQAIICLMRWQDAYKYGVNLTPEQAELFEQFLLECRNWVMSR